MRNLCFLFELEEPKIFLVSGSVFVHKFSHGQVICGLRLGLRVGSCAHFSSFTSDKSSEFPVSALPAVKLEQQSSITLLSTSKPMGGVG